MMMRPDEHAGLQAALEVLVAHYGPLPVVRQATQLAVEQGAPWPVPSADPALRAHLAELLAALTRFDCTVERILLELQGALDAR